MTDREKEKAGESNNSSALLNVTAFNKFRTAAKRIIFLRPTEMSALRIQVIEKYQNIQ